MKPPFFLLLASFITRSARANFVRCNENSTKMDGPVATGVLHIGANAAAEAGMYAACVGANVLFFECNPEMALRCRASAARFGQRCVQGCLSNARSRVPFFVSDNDGMSSSLRPFNDHRDLYPDVATELAIEVWTTRYDEWQASIPEGLLPAMNVLVVDVQGMDLEVLEGMGELLGRFDVLLVEISTVELYAGQRLALETDAYVKRWGFYCHGGCEPCDHCDRLYRRDKPSLDARFYSTFPCSYKNEVTFRLPGGRTGEVAIPVDLNGFESFEEFWVAARLRFRDLCESTVPPGLASPAMETNIRECATELEVNMNYHVIESCDEFPDDVPAAKPLEQWDGR